MGKAQYKVEGGKLVKAEITTKDNKIIKVKITGDFFLHPEEIIDGLENAVEGAVLHEQVLTNRIRTFIKKSEAVLIGASPEDFAKCIVMAGAIDD